MTSTPPLMLSSVALAASSALFTSIWQYGGKIASVGMIHGPAMRHARAGNLPAGDPVADADAFFQRRSQIHGRSNSRHEKLVRRNLHDLLDRIFVLVIFQPFEPAAGNRRRPESPGGRAIRSGPASWFCRWCRSPWHRAESSLPMRAPLERSGFLRSERWRDGAAELPNHRAACLPPARSASAPGPGPRSASRS